MLPTAPPDVRVMEVEVAEEQPLALSIADLPDVEDLVTEDDTPVDNIFSEKQQRLATEPLYSSWGGPGEGRPFLAAANVGVFPSVHRPPLVPDAFLSLDVRAPADLWPKRNRSYFLWEYGKPPEVVIEVVSNREGHETGRKMREYARMGVTYYVIFDPLRRVQRETLRVYSLRDGSYNLMRSGWLPLVGLGLVLWRGVFEGQEDEWLRWCDGEGNLIPTGAELADQERQRAEREKQRAERLAAQLRALGAEPENG